MHWFGLKCHTSDLIRYISHTKLTMSHLAGVWYSTWQTVCVLWLMVMTFVSTTDYQSNHVCLVINQRVFLPFITFVANYSEW